ncbi:hypothetical protein Elgi_30730 [Paenibacillus elgii]|uniref:hypothetical protein n=1 Tax=Paenibacillus elgii TaxID=189691 RepID=UPI002D7DFF11|nr:hypothetical protein Elgi_30730 [Paenibacillus elgii]
MGVRIIRYRVLLALLSTTIFFVRTPKIHAQPERIPEKMDPGTVIHYVADNKYEVLAKGTSLSDPEAVRPPEKKDKYLPRGKKGVTVEYGVDGRPSYMKGVSFGEENPGRPVPHALGIVQPASKDGEVMEGNVSMYGLGGYAKNERGFPLDNFTCATNQEMDDPPYGSTVVLKNLENGKVAYLKKKDVGRLHAGVVLDIRPHVFENVLGVNRDLGWLKGAYFHD